MRRLMLIAIAISTLGCGYERDLSGDEIRALFTGAHVTGFNDRHRYSFHSEYGTDRYRSWQGPSEELREASWDVMGSQMCIRWDDGAERLCRRIATDDRGHYRKVLITRRGGRRTIVTFHSFRDADGRDRAMSVDSGTYFWNWMTSWRGGLVVLCLVLLLVLAAWALTAGEDDPTSLRNRLKKRFLPLEVDGRTYRWGELTRGPPEGLGNFARGSAKAYAGVYSSWAFDLMWQQEADPAEALRRYWKAVEPLQDSVILNALSKVVTRGVDETDMAKAFESNIRASYLFGSALQQLAQTHQRDALKFASYKAASLKLLQQARERAGAPPDLIPEGAPYRAAPMSTIDYAALAGPAYETMMYLQYIAPPTPPPRSSSSSSYSGGG